MLGLLGKIFGSGKMMEAGSKAIDALVFTNEEKAKLHVDFLSKYEPFKLAQRYLAFMFSGIFLLVYLNAVILWNVGVLTSNLEMQGFYMVAAFELAEWNTKTLGAVILVVVGFYFAGGVFKIKNKGM